MTTTVGPRELPELEANKELIVPPSAETTLPNGLTIIVIERRTVPLVEIRLRMPFGRFTVDPPFVARAALMSQTLFAGTAEMSKVDIASRVQSVGGGLSASVDADRLLVSGNALADGLERLLRIVGDVLHGAAYPDGEVMTEQRRLLDRIRVAHTQPSHLARVALLKRMYGTHPYAVQTPSLDDVEGLDRSALSALHDERVRPSGAVLVIVGDVDADATVELVADILGSWSGTGPGESVPEVPPLVGSGPIVLVDRAGSVQSSIRLALPAVPRTHPDNAALQLANLVFGGYFSSRWVENVREDKGYTYGAHSIVEHSLAGSSLILSTDVATDVTTPALLETYYELGRIALVPPGKDELEQARQYALGSLLLGMSTQTGLAGLASTFAGHGLRLDYLIGHAARLASASIDEVAAAAGRYLAPAKAATVVLGDVSQIEASLQMIASVNVTTGD